MTFSMRLLVVLCAFAFADASRVNVKNVRIHDVLAGESQGTCTEPAVEDVCNCQWTSGKGGYQCHECKDGKTWGHGCQLECPSRCPSKCDFGGSCVADDPCPANCKRNGRAEHATDASICLNSEGFCQSCEQDGGGWYGLMCQKKCPGNCERSKVEGKCTRGGNCYSCKTNFYGEKCDKKCPEACPKGQCYQRDGLDENGEFVPAGSCKIACKSGKYGVNCELKCPGNCLGGCSRDKGVCNQCKPGFWGDFCDSPCNSACLGNVCRKEDGFCEKGCQPGFWGDDCSKDCDQFSLKESGCDRITGLPNACDDTHYPVLGGDGMGKCEDCPSNCANRKCSDDGYCSEGCIEGYHGQTCSQQCPDNCVGGCDQETGQCKACTPGKTGKFCKESCHLRCTTCVQFHVGSKTGKPGNQKEDCLSCPADDASELKSDKGPAECVCIKAAHRNEENAPCTCESPSDEFMEAILLKEENSYKKCDSKCKQDYKGQELRDVYGEMSHKCITVNLYVGVVITFHTSPPALGSDGCKADEYPIQVEGEGKKCLRQDFVKYITGKK